jgi:hypothetical protein
MWCRSPDADKEAFFEFIREASQIWIQPAEPAVDISHHVNGGHSYIQKIRHCWLRSF